MGSSNPVRGCTDSGLPAFALHWDGTSWTCVPTPTSFVYGMTDMTGISASGRNDVWAVGTESSYNTSNAVAIHWNGSAWSVSPTGLDNPYENELYGVFAAARNDAWAVGADLTGPFALHWDGTLWTRQSLPANVAPNAIAAAGPNDVWVVGYKDDNARRPLPDSAHWGGGSWQEVVTPNPNHNGALLGVGALASGLFAGVGESGRSKGSVITSPQPLVLTTRPN